MQTPLVSVIMPCYNDGKYITQAINSVIEQTYKNWELIIVDDGSTDKLTIDVLQALKNDKIKVIKNNHQGVVKARNTGIENASGKYIVPIDSDDIAESTLLEKYVNVAQKEDNVGIVYCVYKYFDMRTGIYSLPKYSLTNMLVSNCITNTSLFKKEDWEKVGGYNSNMELGCEDYDFWLSLLELGREVRFVNEALLNYRVRPNSGRTKEIDINKEKAIARQIVSNHINLYKANFNECIVAEKEKAINLQQQINGLFNEKYKIRKILYKSSFIYKFLHFFK